MSARGPSARVGEILREETPPLDDLRRARLERRFLEAAAARSGATAATERGEAREPGAVRRPARALAGLGVLGVAAAAAALGALALRDPAPSYTIERVRGGEIAAGTVLEVGTGEEAHAEIFDLSLAASAGAHVRFEAVSRDDIRLALSHGEVRFAFHPEERGRERVTIETPSARVEIVGTELSVRVEAGATHVAVTEGRVRVVPTDGGEPVLVSANESVRIEAEDARGSADSERGSADAERGGADAERGVTSAERGGADAARDVAPAAREGEDAERGVTAEPLGDGVLAGAEPRAAGADDPAGESTASDVEGVGALGLATGTGTLSARERLDRAEVLLDSDPSAARSELRALTGRASPRAVRVDAHNLLGESFEAAHDTEAALREYAEAARLGRGTAGGATATFDGARLAERAGDSATAREGYERYLREYPDGANAVQVRNRLEALGGMGGR